MLAFRDVGGNYLFVQSIFKVQFGYEKVFALLGILLID